MVSRRIILLSGGLDSQVMLYKCLEERLECHALTVDYGQHNRAELFYANEHGKLAASHRIISITWPWATPLTADPARSVAIGGNSPNYVPGRNTLLLSLAMSLAEVIRAETIYIGANAEDQAGFPDCRPEFFDAFEKLTEEALGRRVYIHNPWVYKAKKEIVEEGRRLKVPLQDSSSCYRPQTKYGPGCGECPACVLRKEALRV